DNLVHGRSPVFEPLTASFWHSDAVRGPSTPTLSEDAEAYEVDVVNNGGIVRTLSSPQPSILYANAQELADFGSLQSTLSVRVAQLSAAAGRGFERHVVIGVG
uniref:hypothetical protein n=1 Tax=Microvirga soli TaxID=1854496 RepID=UPI001AED733E